MDGEKAEMGVHFWDNDFMMIQKFLQMCCVIALLPFIFPRPKEPWMATPKHRDEDITRWKKSLLLIRWPTSVKIPHGKVLLTGMEGLRGVGREIKNLLGLRKAVSGDLPDLKKPFFRAYATSLSLIFPLR